MSTARFLSRDAIDIAVDLTRKRLRHTYGDEIKQTYIVHGGADPANPPASVSIAPEDRL